MKKKKVKEERFEFVFYINNNIIVQRFFYIPRYNENFSNSIELKELMDNLMGMNNDELGSLGMIPDSFKEQSMRELWSYYNPSFIQQEDRIKNWDLFAKEDKFTLEIKVDKEVVAEAEFCGNYFPTSIRHSVNINPIISNIITEIIYFMSLEEYTTIEEYATA